MNKGISGQVFLDDMLAGYDACRQRSAEDGKAPESFCGICGVAQAMNRELGTGEFWVGFMYAGTGKLLYIPDKNTERLVVWFDELIVKTREEFESGLEEHFQFPVKVTFRNVK